MINFISIF
jgi:hypothetical protein